MQIKQKLSKQIVALCNGYINKGLPRGTTVSRPQGMISKAHLQAWGTQCVRVALFPKSVGSGFSPWSGWTCWHSPFTPPPSNAEKCPPSAWVPRGVGVLCQCDLQGYKGEYNLLRVKYVHHQNMAQFLLDILLLPFVSSLFCSPIFPPKNWLSSPIFSYCFVCLVGVCPSKKPPH